MNTWFSPSLDRKVSNDITKGTGLYSLKQFFDMFFDSSEYNLFKKYSNILADKVKDYYGFQIVRTLTPNSFHYYKKVVRMLKYNMLEIPIYYFRGERNEYDFYFSNEDPLITYDSNQEPNYSGVYFRRPGNSKSLFKLTDSNIPEEIWERKLIIGRQGPSFKPTGPLVKIFKDGNFFKIE